MNDRVYKGNLRTSHIRKGVITTGIIKYTFLGVYFFLLGGFKYGGEGQSSGQVKGSCRRGQD